MFATLSGDAARHGGAERLPSSLWVRHSGHRLESRLGHRRRISRQRINQRTNLFFCGPRRSTAVVTAFGLPDAFFDIAATYQQADVMLDALDRAGFDVVKPHGLLSSCRWSRRRAGAFTNDVPFARGLDGRVACIPPSFSTKTRQTRRDWALCRCKRRTLTLPRRDCPSGKLKYHSHKGHDLTLRPQA